MPAPGTCQRQLPISTLRSCPPDTIVDIMEIPDSELYKTLFDLSQSIAGHSDLETLCNSLAGSLRRVVSFDFLALVLHDPVHDQLRLHAVSANRPYKDKEIILPADGEHFGAKVWREQKPLVLSPLEKEEAGSGDVIQEALEVGIHALTLVPLSNGDRRLGILGFGFSAPFKPDEEALAFLQRVASEVAVSVDGYLARQALLRERDRMRVSFEITNALVSKLPMDELFSAISEQLSRVVAHDFAVVTLLDKATGEIHLKGLHSPGGLQYEPEETSGRPEGLPSGEALASGKPVVTTGLDFERFPSPLYRKFADMGFSSSCSIPLAGANGMLGVLDLARKSGEPFTDDEVDLLVQGKRQRKPSVPAMKLVMK
jgi:GAF domain-containing protein